MVACSWGTLHLSGASFQLFLGGPKFLSFFNATWLLESWKKQHFICSNLTLFIVPFFHFFLFFSFFAFFYFSFFFSFFIFPWGRRPPSPLKWRLWHLSCYSFTRQDWMPSTKLRSLVENERSLYPCLFRGRQVCTCAENKYQYNLNTQHKNKLFNLHFTFKHVTWLNFAFFQNNRLVSFCFILNSHEPGPGPKSRVLNWLRRLCFTLFLFNRRVCVRFGTERYWDIETIVKSNGVRIIK